MRVEEVCIRYLKQGATAVSPITVPPFLSHRDVPFGIQQNSVRRPPCRRVYSSAAARSGSAASEQNDPVCSPLVHVSSWSVVLMSMSIMVCPAHLPAANPMPAPQYHLRAHTMCPHSHLLPNRPPPPPLKRQSPIDWHARQSRPTLSSSRRCCSCGRGAAADHLSHRAAPPSAALPAPLSSGTG